MKVYKQGQQVTLQYFVPGLLRDTVYTINSVSNTGTRRSPQYRYYLGGAGYVDHDAIRLINTEGNSDE